jgi:hypothetical protein
MRAKSFSTPRQPLKALKAVINVEFKAQRLRRRFQVFFSESLKDEWKGGKFFASN